MARPEISRLPDGRLVRFNKAASRYEVWEGGAWVVLTGVLTDDLWEARPLPAAEIALLRSAGTLPQ